MLHIYFQEQKEEANKNLEIFKLERELEEQAKSYTDVLNEKDVEITKVRMQTLPIPSKKLNLSTYQCQN